jgi:flagellar basal-body rod protein FlgC
MAMFDSLIYHLHGLQRQRLRMDVIGSDNSAKAREDNRSRRGARVCQEEGQFAPVNIRPNINHPWLPDRIDSGVGQGVRL